MKARPSTSKLITAALLRHSLYCRGLEPNSQYFQGMPIPYAVSLISPFSKFWHALHVLKDPTGNCEIYHSLTPQHQLYTTERSFDPGYAIFNFFSGKKLIIVLRHLVFILGRWSQVKGHVYLIDTPTVIKRMRIYS